MRRSGSSGGWLSTGRRRPGRSAPSSCTNRPPPATWVTPCARSRSRSPLATPSPSGTPPSGSATPAGRGASPSTSRPRCHRADAPPGSGRSSRSPSGETNIKRMRRESSTVVVLVGEVDDRLVAGLGRSPNISVARAPAPDQPAAAEPPAGRASWGAGGRRKQFELPDYSLVMASAGGTGPDLYLGPLRAARPRRVAVAVADSPAAGVARLLGALRSPASGPWWPL